MGIMNAIRTGLGISKGERCYQCDKVVVRSGMRMPIITPSIESWANPLAGYCKRCQVFVCSEHAIFVEVEEMTYLSGCPKCRSELQT